MWRQQMHQSRYTLIACLLLCLIPGTLWAQAAEPEGTIRQERARGRVVEVIEDTTFDDQSAADPQLQGMRSQTIRVLVETGALRGETVRIDNTNISAMSQFFVVSRGDRIRLVLEVDETGSVVQGYVAGFVRDQHLLYLALAFAVVLALIGGWKGVKAVLGLALTGLAIVYVLLPALLHGHNPLWVALALCVVLVPVTFLLISGINRKTLIASLGTLAGLVIAGVIAVAIGAETKLTGLGEEEMAALIYLPNGTHFDFRGLLFAGVLIGTLGGAMDVSMSVASAMMEVVRVNPRIAPRELVRTGMNVGRDIMGTMSNTLILAYTGSALPLMMALQAYQTPLQEIINDDVIATEVVHALAGSIGLIGAIPLTALIGGFLARRQAHTLPPTDDVSAEEPALSA